MEATPGSGVRAEMLAWIKDAEGKLLQLAEATPESKYAWRPGKDVRSTGEVFMHVAAANFGKDYAVYPLDPAEANLRAMATLHSAFGVPVGRLVFVLPGVEFAR